LIVIDRQLDGGGKPLAHRAGDREVLLEVGMAESQLPQLPVKPEKACPNMGFDSKCRAKSTIFSVS
jgi:hypothetical protein